MIPTKSRKRGRPHAPRTTREQIDYITDQLFRHLRGRKSIYKEASAEKVTQMYINMKKLQQDLSLLDDYDLPYEEAVSNKLDEIANSDEEEGEEDGSE